MPTYCPAIKHCRHISLRNDTALVKSAADNAVSSSSLNCGTGTTLKDSGERREVPTGAVRDRAVGKGRFDLLPLYGLLLGAQQNERGALKYSARNWEKGMPLSWFADAAMRHLGKYIAGFDDEPHLAAAIWNVMGLAEGEKRIEMGLWPKEMDDLPHTYAGKEPGF